MEKQKEGFRDKLFKLIDYKIISSLDTVEKVDNHIAEVLLLQKENQDILGIPGKHHSQQEEKVLKEERYWWISNIIQVLNLRKRVLNENLNTFHSFTGGGSIGVGYLGSMLKNFENDKFPDVIFGYSAGALFPAMFLLYKKARELNPDKAGTGLESIFNILPKGLEGKDMFFNGEELIEAFKKSSQNLIDIINEKLPENEKLPDIYNIAIDDLSKNFKIIAGRKEKTFVQEVIFGGKDKLLSSVIASSNPELNILGIDVKVLTSTQNKFYSNDWIDGFHANPNLISYSKIVGTTNKFESVSMRKYSDILKNIRGEIHTVFYIPDLKNFLEGSEIGDYKDIDQNGNWGESEMKLKIIMSYYKILSYSNIGFFLEDIEKNIKDEKVVLNIKHLLLNRDLIFYSYVAGNINNISESINKIRKLGFLNEKQKQELIVKVFYHSTGIESKKNIPQEGIVDEEGNDISSSINEINQTTLASYVLKADFLSNYLPKYLDDGFNEISSKDVKITEEQKILSYISVIGFLDEQEDYEKIILGFFSREELFKMLLNNGDNKELILRLFIDSSLLNTLGINYITQFYLHSLKNIPGYEVELRKETMNWKISKKLLKLGRRDDEEKFREFLELNGY